MESYTNNGYMFEEVNFIENLVEPSQTYKYTNAATRFWFNALKERFISRFNFENLPENWLNDDYIVNCLIFRGYFVVYDSEEFGVIPQECGLTGMGIFKQPLKAVVNLVTTANAGISEHKEIDLYDEGVLVKINDNFTAPVGIISYYSQLLGMLTRNIDMGLLYEAPRELLGVTGKNAAKTIKKALDETNAGNPWAIYDLELAGDTKHDKLGTGSFLLPDQLQEIKNIINLFDQEIGINNTYFEKKERLIQDEVNSNNADLLSRSWNWCKNIRDGIDKVNKRFGLNITFSFNDSFNEDGRIQK